MPYRFILGGVEVQCDTAQELRAALAGGRDAVQATMPPAPEITESPFPRAKPPRHKSVPLRRLGAKKSWQMGRWLAEREGGTPEQCRSRLAQMKKSDFPSYEQLEGEFLASIAGKAAEETEESDS